MSALIIDTSHTISSIFLLKKNGQIVSKQIKENLKLSKYLHPILSNLLEKENLKYIAISSGPGSYTGLRVGASVGKTFSYVKKIPLISYCSMQAYLPENDGPFISAFDAKTSGVYMLFGEKKNSTIKYAGKPKLVSLEELKKYFKKTSLIISPDAQVIKEKLNNPSQVKIEEKAIDPNYLFSLTNSLFDNKKFENFNEFKLLYLRGPNHLEK